MCSACRSLCGACRHPASTSPMGISLLVIPLHLACLYPRAHQLSASSPAGLSGKGSFSLSPSADPGSKPGAGLLGGSSGKERQCTGREHAHRLDSPHLSAQDAGEWMTWLNGFAVSAGERDGASWKRVPKRWAGRLGLPPLPVNDRMVTGYWQLGVRSEDRPVFLCRFRSLPGRRAAVSGPEAQSRIRTAALPARAAATASAIRPMA